MSCLNSISASHLSQDLRAVHPVFQVRWRSLQGTLREREFVVGVEILANDQCMLEAWIEQDGRRIPTRSQSACQMMCTRRAGMLHVDVHDGSQRDRPLLALSIEWDDGHASTLWYAATSLLQLSGFAAGSYDRPAFFIESNQSRAADALIVTCDAVRSGRAIASA